MRRCCLRCYSRSIEASSTSMATAPMTHGTATRRLCNDKLQPSLPGSAILGCGRRGWRRARLLATEPWAQSSDWDAISGQNLERLPPSLPRRDPDRCFEFLGERVMMRPLDRQVAELQVRSELLNRFTQFGQPQTIDFTNFDSPNSMGVLSLADHQEKQARGDRRIPERLGVSELLQLDPCRRWSSRPAERFRLHPLSG